MNSVEGVAGVPGVYSITTPSGGAWKTIDGGDTWSPIYLATPAPVSGDPHRWVDPVNSKRVVRTETHGIGVSLDEGRTWMSFRHLPIAEVARLEPREHPAESLPAPRTIAGTRVNVSIVDPARAGLVFAGTNAGVFVSFDNGSRWQSIQLNLPGVRINDLDIRGNDLVAATQGRSIWTLADISPLRQINATSASAAAILFAPADVEPAASGRDVPLDYYLGASVKGSITLEVADAAGRVVHRASSDAVDATDRWLPVSHPFPATPGHHRVDWDLRVDPPASPHHRFARLAPALFQNEPADLSGPRVLPGAYRVTLNAGGRSYSQPLVVRADPALTAEQRADRQQQFDLAMKTYDAMVAAHHGFLQLTRVRDQLKPLLASPDSDVATPAADLDARLAVIDGSDWTGLVIPDADDDSQEALEDAKEGKHPDFVPPKPVSLSKDYDDPTTVLGRTFGNVDHAPAFAIVGTKLGETITRLDRENAAPDALATGNYAMACQQLAGVLDEWRAINAQDLPRINAVLGRRKLPALPIATGVPTVACALK